MDLGEEQALLNLAVTTQPLYKHSKTTTLVFDTACSEDSCEEQVHVFFKPVHTLESLILDDFSTWTKEEEKYKYEKNY